MHPAAPVHARLGAQRPTFDDSQLLWLPPFDRSPLCCAPSFGVDESHVCELVSMQLNVGVLLVKANGQVGTRTGLAVRGREGAVRTGRLGCGAILAS
jgi:hypothetical protein